MNAILFSMGAALLIVAASGCGVSTSERASGAAALPDEAQAALPQVSIVGVTGAGTGCAPGSIHSTLGEGGKTLSLELPQMALESRPDRTFQRVFCTAGISVHLPPGWQLTVGAVESRGHAQLPPGAHADVSSSYSYAGQPLGEAFSHRLNGPYEGEYAFSDDVSTHSPVGSPCGGDAIFNLELGLNLDTTGSGSALAHVDTNGTPSKKILRWQLRECS